MGGGYLAIKRRIHILTRDLSNTLKYGKNAPYYGQTIFISPASCNDFMITEWGRKHSGNVVDGDWDLKTIPLMEYPKFKFCIQHWQEGLSWKETGAYDFLLGLIAKKGGPVDNCLTLPDVIRRYEVLDTIFDQLSDNTKFYLRKQLYPENFRETGGIFFHINRHNAPIFGGGGVHRLAMSKILKFDIIPAQLGVVHKDAIKSWASLKKKPNA